VGRHVAPLGHITLIPGQPVFALSYSQCCLLSGEAIHTNVIVFGLIGRGSNPRSIAHEAGTLILTPPMRYGYARIYIVGMI